MKNKNTLLYISALVAFIFFVGCSPTFRSGYDKFLKHDYPSARPILERYREHPQHAPAARFYLGKMALSETRDLPGLLAIDHSLAEADSLLCQMHVKQAKRLARRFEVDTSALLDLREQTQRWAVADTRAKGTLSALDSLLEGLKTPLTTIRPDVRETRTDIVNAHLYTTDYDTMTAILQRHVEVVLPENYDQTRRMNETIWTAFLEKYTPCELDRFTNQHWRSFVARDCWRKEVQALLCEGKLPEQLKFHNSNSWSALEIVLLNAVADLSSDSTLVDDLKPEHQMHLRDIQCRTALRNALHNGTAARDTFATLEQTSAYITRYAPRYSAFRLMEETLQFFLDRQLYSSAIILLERARPHFPDTLPPGCHTDFDFQRRVRPWIDGKLPILRRPDRTIAKHPLTALNTAAGEEFSPVVRADRLEILFAGKNRPDNIIGTDVFAAKWDDAKQDWGVTTLVPTLSGPGNYVPLSMTADGLLLLVSVNNRLHTCLRTTSDTTWSLPVPLPVSGIAIIGNGCLSADGNTLVLEGAYSAGSATQTPDLDLFVSHRDPKTGTWSTPAALGADINTDGQEAAPYLMPDGQTLFYTSTGYPGLGRSDIFSARRTRADWTHWTYPENLGKELNNTNIHRGFTTVSPNSRRAWLSAGGDLWMLEF